MLRAAVKPDRDPRRTRSTRSPRAVNRSGPVAPARPEPRTTEYLAHPKGASADPGLAFQIHKAQQ
jgi:hypothetical protein